MMRGNELQQEYYHASRGGKEYDIVVRLRTDLIFDRIVNPIYYFTSEKEMATLSEPSKGLFVPENTLILPYDMHWGGYCDLFALGRPNVMNWYFSQIEHVREIFETTHQPLHPETYLKLHMDAKGFKGAISKEIDCKVTRELLW